MTEKSVKKIIIGSRGSELAVRQAEQVRAAIVSTCPEYKFSDIIIKKIKTTGDRLLNQSLSKIGGKGLFTKEIEESLLANDIDLAVHSMKDMPTTSPNNLAIRAVLPREDARDAFISLKYKTLAELPLGASIGTSSLRRQAIILAKRPDLKIIPMRGNINSRLVKLHAGEADAIILAVSGLNRLGIEYNISQYLSDEVMLPAVGQGAVAIEIKRDNAALEKIINRVNDHKTEIAVKAERRFMLGVDGDCRTPMAAYAEIDGYEIYLRTQVLYPDGSDQFACEIKGDVLEYKELADQLISKTKKNAADLLKFIKENYN